MGKRLARAAAMLAVVALGLAIFCWWGLFTAAGLRRFDEMDGLYPLGAGALSAALLAIAAILAIVARRRA